MSRIHAPPGYRRMIVPLCSGVNIHPTQEFQIGARPQVLECWPELISVKDPASWRVSSVGVYPHVPPTGPYYRSSSWQGDPLRSVSGADLRGGDLTGLGVVRAGEAVVASCEYVGDDRRGAQFEAWVMTRTTEGRPAVVRSGDPGLRSGVLAASGVVSRHTTIALRSPAPASEMWADRIGVEDADDWVVHGVVVTEVGDSGVVREGRSLFARDLDKVPARLLDVDDSPLSFGSVSPNEEVTVYATYVGPEAEATLRYAVFGSTVPPTARAPRSTVLPMSSGVNILPNTSAQVTARLDYRLPAGHGFQARRIVLAEPRDWVVSEIKVGNISQFMQGGDVPGVAFAHDAVGCELALDVLDPRRDFSIVATYVGPSDAGAEFVCGVLGDVVPLDA